jgi:hypothetical protein
MNLRNVVFLGGRYDFPSVKVRCIDIANRLGCDYLISKPYAHQIPEKYRVFVCVKAFFYRGQINELAQRGAVIWDIIDTPPPEQDVSIYLVSSKLAREAFKKYGRVSVIPHHHCNISGAPNPPGLRRPAWIGTRHWLPPFKGFACDFYNVQGMLRNDVVRAHRKIGIGLNFRNDKPAIYQSKQQKLMYNFHVAINSGIKLINCIGFGIPSISSLEPAYHAIGKECTIFSDLKKCAHWVRALQNDEALYLDLRGKCLRKAKKYHLDTIAEKYRKLLLSL